MPLRLSGHLIFSEDGKLLKEINCPKRIKLTDMAPAGRTDYHCASCEKKIINTDFMSEGKLEALLKANSNVCLYINKLNPIFQIEE